MSWHAFGEQVRDRVDGDQVEEVAEVEAPVRPAVNGGESRLPIVAGIGAPVAPGSLRGGSFRAPRSRICRRRWTRRWPRHDLIGGGLLHEPQPAQRPAARADIEGSAAPMALMNDGVDIHAGMGIAARPGDASI